MLFVLIVVVGNHHVHRKLKEQSGTDSEDTDDDGSVRSSSPAPDLLKQLSSIDEVDAEQVRK